jgi:hypothetical protein
LVFTVKLQVDSTWFRQLTVRHFLVYFSLHWLSHVGINLRRWHHYHMLQSCCYSVTTPRITQWLCSQRLRATELFPWYSSYAMQSGNHTITAVIYYGHSQTNKNGRCKAHQLSNGFLYSSLQFWKWSPLGSNSVQKCRWRPSICIHHTPRYFLLCK